MKNILICIQQRLEAQVPALKHIDRNWGQLNIPQPPVKFPCCLVDIDVIDYSQASGGCRLATAQISLTVADQHTVRSSAKAPARDDAFAMSPAPSSIVCIPSEYSRHNAVESTRLPPVNCLPHFQQRYLWTPFTWPYFCTFVHPQ